MPLLLSRSFRFIIRLSTRLLKVLVGSLLAYLLLGILITALYHGACGLSRCRLKLEDALAYVLIGHTERKPPAVEMDSDVGE